MCETTKPHDSTDCALTWSNRFLQTFIRYYTEVCRHAALFRSCNSISVALSSGLLAIAAPWLFSFCCSCAGVLGIIVLLLYLNCHTDGLTLDSIILWYTKTTRTLLGAEVLWLLNKRISLPQPWSTLGVCAVHHGQASLLWSHLSKGCFCRSQSCATMFLWDRRGTVMNFNKGL